MPKKIIFSTLLMLMSTVCSQESLLLIDFVDVRDAKAEELLNIMEGGLENLAIHFPKGVSLPLKPKFTGEFFELITGDAELMIEIKKDIYVRSLEGTLLFSSDLQEWREMESFMTGNVFAGLIKGDTDPICAKIEVEVNERK